MERNYVIGAVGVLLLVGAVGIGFAATDSTQANPDLSKEEAMNIAENEVGGTAQSAVLEQEDDFWESESGPIYEVTVEKADGSLVEVEVDGNSGEVLETETADGEDEGSDDA